jgi:serine protease Do
VRWVGRVIDTVDSEGPAERAGLRAGDVIVSADGVRLFSQDDLDDLLRVSEPGQSLALQVLRSDDSDSEPVSIDVTLGSEVVTSAAQEPLRWQYASLEQLPLALGAAREKHKRVLVGLSGAET